jgi:hypothetical protein
MGLGLYLTIGSLPVCSTPSQELVIREAGSNALIVGGEQVLGLMDSEDSLVGLDFDDHLPDAIAAVTKGVKTWARSNEVRSFACEYVWVRRLIYPSIYLCDGHRKW